MFYKLVRAIFLSDKNETEKPFFAELYDDELAVVYYRTLLQAQQQVDLVEENSHTLLGDLRLNANNIKAIIKKMKKEDCIKTIIAENPRDHVAYPPRKFGYKKLKRSILAFDMIKGWPEYTEDVYV